MAQAHYFQTVTAQQRGIWAIAPDQNCNVVAVPLSARCKVKYVNVRAADCIRSSYDETDLQFILPIKRM